MTFAIRLKSLLSKIIQTQFPIRLIKLKLKHLKTEDLLNKHDWYSDSEWVTFWLVFNLTDDTYEQESS